MLEIVLNSFFFTVANLVFTKVLEIGISDSRKTEEDIEIKCQCLQSEWIVETWPQSRLPILFPNAQC